jgi:hypothetical protein
LGKLDKALDFYGRGNFYGKAIQVSRGKFTNPFNKSPHTQIARLNYPEKVVHLEEQWADWLYSEGNYDVAVPHYLG